MKRNKHAKKIIDKAEEAEKVVVDKLVEVKRHIEEIPVVKEVEKVLADTEEFVEKQINGIVDTVEETLTQISDQIHTEEVVPETDKVETDAKTDL